MDEITVGRVGELRCFPVKSMLGLPTQEAVFDGRAMRHDRLWAVRGRAGKLGSGKAARRFQRIGTLPFVTAYHEERRDDEVRFRLPDGTELRSSHPEIDAQLSAALGEAVTLHREGEETHFDDSPVHLVTRREIEEVEKASGVAIDTLRLRANIVVTPATEGPEEAVPPERQWPGRQIRLGDEVVLEVIEPMQRCVMVNQETSDVPADSNVLKAVAAHNHMTLGLCLRVVRTGRVRVGDAVRLISVPGTSSTLGA